MDSVNPTFLEELAEWLDKVKSAWDRLAHDAIAV